MARSRAHPVEKVHEKLRSDFDLLCLDRPHSVVATMDPDEGAQVRRRLLLSERVNVISTLRFDDELLVLAVEVDNADYVILFEQMSETDYGIIVAGRSLDDVVLAVAELGGPASLARDDREDLP